MKVEKNKIEVQVLISTLNNGIEKLKDFSFRREFSYLVVHQIDKILNSDAELVIKKIKNDVNTEYHTLNKRGLSFSRNFAISIAKSNYIWLMDDDVVLRENSYETIKKVMSKLDADIVTFKMVDENDMEFKSYKNSCFRHNTFTINKVSSIEMVAKLKFLKEKNIVFDECLGLGSAHPVGEENLFLLNCLKESNRVYFYPAVVAQHPCETTGRKVDLSLAENKGYQFYLMYGKYSCFIVLLFAIKKYKLYRRRYSFIVFFKKMLSGFNTAKKDHTLENQREISK